MLVYSFCYNAPFLSPCELRRPPGAKQAAPYGSCLETPRLSCSGSEARSLQVRSGRKYNTRLDVYLEAKTTFTPLRHIRYIPQAKEAAAHPDDFARAWTSPGRCGARQPDYPLVHPAPRSYGEIRGRNDAASCRPGALSPHFHSNSCLLYTSPSPRD